MDADEMACKSVKRLCALQIGAYAAMSSLAATSLFDTAACCACIFRVTTGARRLTGRLEAFIARLTVFDKLTQAF